MRFCIIDTESNGLFVYKEADGTPRPSDHPDQPRLASLALILLDDGLNVVEEYSSLVRPDGWAMKPDATAVNGLTTEMLIEHGKPVGEVLAVYEQAVREGYAMAAYNAQHDLRQMRGELRRCGRPDLFNETRNVCLMRKSRGIIPRPDGQNTWPKLDHARDFLHLSHEGKHTAGADAASALAVLRYLQGKGVDLTPEVHLANQGAKKPKASKPKRGEDERPIAPVDTRPLADQDIPE